MKASSTIDKISVKPINFPVKKNTFLSHLVKTRRSLLSYTYKTLVRLFSMKCCLCGELSCQYDYCHYCGNLSCSNCYQEKHKLFDGVMCRYKYHVVFMLVQFILMTIFLKIQFLLPRKYNYYFIMFMVFVGLNSYIPVYVARKILKIKANMNIDRISICLIMHSVSFILCFLKDSQHMIISKAMNESFVFWLKIVVFVNILVWFMIISLNERKVFY